MRRLSSSILAVLLALLLLPEARAADCQPIVVYLQGKKIRHDDDVGADLKEVYLETYDCKVGKLVKRETIEAYFHLSDDREIITPDAICDECRKKFIIEKKGDKYYFGGIREKEASHAEAEAAAPLPATGTAVKTLEVKVKRLAEALAKIDPEAPGSAKQRSAMVNDEFTTSLRDMKEPDLQQIAGYVLDDSALGPRQKYLVLRTFGFTFYKAQDYPRSVFFYDKCIELIPDDSSAYFQKAAALQKAGDTERAVRTYVRALATRPNARIAGHLEKLLADTPSTAKIDAEKMKTVKARVEDVHKALAEKDDAKATELAQDLDADLDRWCGPMGRGPIDASGSTGGASAAPPAAASATPTAVPEAATATATPTPQAGTPPADSPAGTPPPD